MSEEKKYQQASPEAHFWICAGFMSASIGYWIGTGINPYSFHSPIALITGPFAFAGTLGVFVGLIEWINNRRKKP